MALDPRILLNPVQIAGPMDMLKAQGAQQEIQSNAMLMQERQRALQEQNAVRSVLSAPDAIGPDGKVSSNAMQSIFRTSPALGMKLQEEQQKVDLQRSQIEQNKATASYRLAQGVYNRFKVDQEIQDRIAAGAASLDTQYQGYVQKYGEDRAQQMITEGPYQDFTKQVKSYGLDPEAIAGWNPKFDPVGNKGLIMSGSGGVKAWEAQQKAGTAGANIRHFNVGTTPENTVTVTEERGPDGQWHFKAQAPIGKPATTAATSGYGNSYENLTPQQQEAVDWYATMSLGGDQSWRTGLARTRGGSDLIKAVDERVPQRGAELGIGPADVGTNKAVRIANQSALTALTKDITTLKPYVAMLDQNADILATLADKAIATNSALANKPLNWLRTHATDSPDVAEYLAQMEILKNESARVISNPRLVGQMTDTARQEIGTIINGDMPINATKRVLERIKNDGQRRIGKMEEQQQDLQGKIKKMFPGATTEAPQDTDLAAKVKAAGQQYEPDKYDYKVEDGKVYRKAK